MRGASLRSTVHKEGTRLDCDFPFGKPPTLAWLYAFSHCRRVSQDIKHPNLYVKSPNNLTTFEMLPLSPDAAGFVALLMYEEISEALKCLEAKLTIGPS